MYRFTCCDPSVWRTHKARQGNCILGTCGGLTEKHEVRRCLFDAPRCHVCQTEFFGGPFLDGWSKTLQVGKYNEVELSKMGVMCKNVSSLHVAGFCCAAKIYQFTDFNEGRTEKSLAALFPEGSYVQ